MGYIKFIDEDGVLDLEDATEEEQFQIWIDLFGEQQKGK
jgi:hypothetical protein